jgi:hypothetical protein
LTFWLSNTVVLREIIAQTFGSSRCSSPIKLFSTNGAKKPDRSSAPTRWKSNYNGKYAKPNIMQVPDDWRETSTFLDALEKIESWIFSRIVESVWWQVKVHPITVLALSRKLSMASKTVMIKTYCKLTQVFSFLKDFHFTGNDTPHANPCRRFVNSAFFG